MRRHGGPAKRARRRGTMCPSPHQGGTDPGCTLRPSADLAPVQKRLRTYLAQFYDFRPIRAQIAATRRRTLRIMVRIVRQGKEMARYRELLELARETRIRKFVTRVQVMMNSAAIARPPRVSELY